MKTLEVTTPTDREIVMTRQFDAPRRLVWEAYTRPELLRRWFVGPGGWVLAVCDVDLRPGGKYRYVWKKDDAEMGMGGVYREVVEPERIVGTEKFDQAWYPGEALGTMVFTEKDGRTTFTQTVLYESREARDAVLKSGFESGASAGYDRLAELLKTLTAERA
jgi:uncharacterized protein YndB with AHSA1/START domain